MSPIQSSSDIPDYAETMSFTIRATETDPDGHLAPAVLFSMAQEASSYSAAALGLNSEELHARGLVWMLSRISVNMVHWPSWRETIKIATWPRQIKRLFYLRDYVIMAEDGSILGTATSDWFLVNTITRRPQRPDVIEEFNRHFENEVIRATTTDALRIRESIPVSHAQSHSYRTRWSDMDRNGHVNNTHYVTWSYNVLREHKEVETAPTAIHVNFLQELMDQAPVDILYTPHVEDQANTTSEQRSYLIEGHISGSPSFRCVMTFE